MTREEARERLRGILTEAVEFENSVCYVTKEDGEPLEMAIKALEQEPCEDAISRNAVIEKLKKEEKILYTPKGLNFLIRTIEELPYVTPKPETVTDFADRCRECGAKYGKLLKQKTGHWIEHEWEEMREKGYYRCSVCNHGYQRYTKGIRKSDVPYIDGQEYILRYTDHYCPNCGAKMEVEE